MSYADGADNRDIRLGSGSDTGHGETNINSWTNTAEEQFSFQKDLTVGDGDNLKHSVSKLNVPVMYKTNISRDICRDITTLGFNDGKGSEGASTKLVAHLGSTLKKTGVEVEDITGVSLTTGGTTKKERHLTVGNSLLRQVIVDNES